MKNLWYVKEWKNEEQGWVWGKKIRKWIIWKEEWTQQIMKEKYKGEKKCEIEKEIEKWK